jgi:hypothetical protein
MRFPFFARSDVLRRLDRTIAQIETKTHRQSNQTGNRINQIQ